MTQSDPASPRPAATDPAASRPVITYADAGVSIDAGNALVKAIGPLAKATRRTGSAAGLGGFGALFDPRAAGFTDPILVGTTDGVGTKLKLAIQSGRHDSIGIDLVAMCVNDLVVQGAEPLFFLDYFASGKLEVATGTAIVRGIADGCAQAGCALIGGETAEMPGLYADGDYDLAGFCVGAFERGQGVDGSRIVPGTALIGLSSSGVHSNGYSLVRRLLAQSGLALADPAPFDSTRSLCDAFLAPTRIYVRPLLALLKALGSEGVLGMAHITGGGLLENVPRMLPEGRGLAARIDAGAWPLPPIFGWLRDQARLPAQELARTFNCGIGMVVAIPTEQIATALACLAANGETAFPVGTIETGEDRACTLTGAAGIWDYADAWTATGHAKA